MVVNSGSCLPDKTVNASIKFAVLSSFILSQAKGPFYCNKCTTVTVLDYNIFAASCMSNCFQLFVAKIQKKEKRRKREEKENENSPQKQKAWG